MSGLQWTVDAYTLVVASFLMLAGSTADRFGRRTVFQIGLATFTLGSLLCSLAPGLGWLVAFRMLQAVGGSMLNPVAMSIITNTFTDPARAGPRDRRLGRRVRRWPWRSARSLGGVLVDDAWAGGGSSGSTSRSGSPRSCSPRCSCRSRAPPRPRRLDPVGQVLVIVTLASLTYAIIEGPRLGLDLGQDPRPVRGSAAAAARRLVIYEPRRDGAAARPAVLPQRAVLRRRR